nr:tetratricopeptide repeat protein [Treponemataceae bacterium]
KSISLYTKVLNRNEENTTALNGLGYVLADSGRDLTRALSLCKKACDIKPDYAAYLDSLGWVYFNLGLYKEAENYTKQALVKLPDNEEIKDHMEAIRGAANENN